MKFATIFVVTFLLLQIFAEASSISAANNSLEYAKGGSEAAAMNKHTQSDTINCDEGCSRRCSQAYKQKRCMIACLSCCHTCQCIPPGTYGNKEVCPCYANSRPVGISPSALEN
ncbi:hypothetical protein L6164_007293 [Bauhinia variegata]|uniref:Uncharacterized protein n=1 Tax=Bauhinia variegata TaxID=167791 RepID=A0ACB9PFX3_BAUVA|nr:hypothetical protein L6164_007293 [Bauhinia variegata]